MDKPLAQPHFPVRKIFNFWKSFLCYIQATQYKADLQPSRTSLISWYEQDSGAVSLFLVPWFETGAMPVWELWPHGHDETNVAPKTRLLVLQFILLCLCTNWKWENYLGSAVAGGWTLIGWHFLALLLVNWRGELIGSWCSWAFSLFLSL